MHLDAKKAFLKNNLLPANVQSVLKEHINLLASSKHKEIILGTLKKHDRESCYNLEEHLLYLL